MITFIAVVEAGSIHAAARELNQSQPGISKKIKQLEEQLGVALLVRSAQGIELTKYGDHFLIRARTIVNETNRATDEITQLRGEREGTVRIIVAPSSTVDLLPQTVRLFQAQFPQVKLEIYEGLQEMAVDKLRLGQVDFAVCPLWQPLVASEFVITEIQRMNMAVVASTNSRFKQVRHMHELQKADWIHVGAGASLSPIVVSVFEQLNLTAPIPTMESYSLTSTLAFMTASDAVALLPIKLAQQPQYAASLIALPIEDTLPQYSLYLIHRRESPLTPTARTLATILERVAAQATLQ